MRLLALALAVLFDALAAQALGARQVAQHLLGAADRLVPLALAAVRVVRRGGARRRHVHGP